MLTDRRLCVFVEDLRSNLKNDLPQGSFSAPILSNLYFPFTLSEKFIYADDIVLACPTHILKIIEKILSLDLKTMRNYFSKWRFSPSTIEIEVSCFHLNNIQKF